MSLPIRRALLALAVLLIPAQAGAGLPAADAKKSEEKPWSRGVPEKEKQLAMEAFRQGNILLKDSVFVHAAARYREALTHWDHPAIHYNLVLALLNLDQPVEVMEHLEAIVRFGPGALDTDKLEQTEAFMAIFWKQIAWVDVTCAEPGAVVKMDGTALFTAPGHWTGRVRAGPHTILASKEGFLTRESSQSLPAGKKTEISIKLYTVEQLTRYNRPFAEWPQWAALATGAVLAGGGGFLHFTARSGFERFDAGISACGGCVPDPALQSLLAGARSQQTEAVAAYVAGGALLATGAILAWIDRPQPYRISPEDLEKGQSHTGLFLVPSGAGLAVAGTF